MDDRHRFQDCDVYGWQRRLRSDGKHLVRLRPIALQHVIRTSHVLLLPPTTNPGTGFWLPNITSQGKLLRRLARHATGGRLLCNRFWTTCA